MRVFKTIVVGEEDNLDCEEIDGYINDELKLINEALGIDKLRYQFLFRVTNMEQRRPRFPGFRRLSDVEDTEG